MSLPHHDDAMPSQDRTLFALLVCTVVVTTLGALLWQWQVLHDFDRAAASLAPGTEIRPMGVTMRLGIAEVGSVLVGVLLLLPALVVGWGGSSAWRWLRLALALLVVALSFVPILHGKSAFLRVVERRQLVLEE